MKYLPLMLLLAATATNAATLDDFSQPELWTAQASDNVSAVKESDGKALRLNYDFANVSGYAGLTRSLSLDFPENYEISLRLRGSGPPNTLELKFVDASGDNVWWYTRRNFSPSDEWQEIRVKQRQIEFAWGTIADRHLRHSARIELVITAAAGGKGFVEFDHLSLTPLPVVADKPLPIGTRWIGKRSSRPQQWTLDFGELREFGGIEVEWLPQQYASRYEIQSSRDGVNWKTLRTVENGDGGEDAHFLPESEARAIRLQMLQGPGDSFGIQEVRIKDLAYGASANAFFQSLAQRAPRGRYPRGITGEQSYWTLVGTADGNNESLISEDGAVEARKGGFSVEPFVKLGEQLITWADVAIEQHLREDYLPIPSVDWLHPKFHLRIEATAQPSQTLARYRLTNTTQEPQAMTLVLAIRPFQVNPPPQFLNTPGGVSFDKLPSVVPITPAASFQTQDESGFASASLAYRFSLAPRETREVSISLPLDEPSHTASADWSEILNRVRFQVPPDAQSLIDTLRTAHAHILINRDGVALQPGSRSYERSWIRDGALESDALLRLGDPQPAKDFLRWYASKQFDNGKIPCCVDARGADPIPENDSVGEFVFLAADVYRYTADAALLREVWPHVQSAMNYLETLRHQDPTFHGLLPASISHEGYSAKPMHSYWDDFWALKGYNAAIEIAVALSDEKAAASYRRSRDEFRSDLQQSLRQTMATHGIRYLPGAAELGDFDPTSTSIAVAPDADLRPLPEHSLNTTFERYWAFFVAREHSTAWDAYTPYELRNISTLVRLGWRERSWRLLNFFMRDRRPAGWNQWAEVVGREPRKARFIGDMPHGWVASDYIRALLDLFAYENEDATLMLMAGIPVDWFRTGFGIEKLRTRYGELSYSVQPDGNRLQLKIDAGLRLPASGIVVDWPCDFKVKHSKILQGQARWKNGRLHVASLPLLVEIEP